jgi:indolepyruvate ferredoxin oxidoreductase alpha subunit
MGAGITIAQGINRIEPDTLNFAFIGDSTFFHTGIPGLINAVYNNADIIIAILDNSTTAMTGGQPHPATGKTLMGTGAPRIDIHGIVSALNVASVQRVNAFDFVKAKGAVLRAVEQKGVRLIIFEGPCIALMKGGQKSPCAINPQNCTGCGLCVKKLGCPALFLSEKKARVDAALCTGCGLCKSVCPVKAIEGGAEFSGGEGGRSC